MVGIESNEVDPRNTSRTIAVERQKATTCDKCNGTDPPSCVFACPHDAAHRMNGHELLELVRRANA
jgi:Fe-S-cluster-containing hydrogenase component 2